MKPKMDHRIKRPFVYIAASATNIAVRFARILAEQRKNEREADRKVEPLRKLSK